jgi:hypothetical protein
VLKGLATEARRFELRQVLVQRDALAGADLAGCAFGHHRGSEQSKSCDTFFATARCADPDALLVWELIVGSVVNCGVRGWHAPKVELAYLQNHSLSRLEGTTLLCSRTLGQSKTWHIAAALCITSDGVSCPDGGIPLICMSISKTLHVTKAAACIIRVTARGTCDPAR